MTGPRCHALRGGASPVRAALGVSDLGGALRANRGGNPPDAGGDRGDDRWCHSRGSVGGSGRARGGSVGGRAGAAGEVGKEGEVELQKEELEGLQEEEEQGLLLSGLLGQRRFRRGADAPAAFLFLGLVAEAALHRCACFQCASPDTTPGQRIDSPCAHVFCAKAPRQLRAKRGRETLAACAVLCGACATTHHLTRFPCLGVTWLSKAATG